FTGHGVFSESMAGLSNSIGRSNDPAGLDQHPGIECRPVIHSEIESALRLILATESGLAKDDAILDFCSYAVERKIDTGAIWIAVHDRRIVWAMLPVPSPGRTMLMFAPTVLFVQTPPVAITMLSTEVCRHHAMRGVQLAQMLIDPS